MREPVAHDIFGSVVLQYLELGEGIFPNVLTVHTHEVISHQNNEVVGWFSLKREKEREREREREKFS